MSPRTSTSNDGGGETHTRNGGETCDNNIIHPQHSHEEEIAAAAMTEKRPFWRIWAFASVLVFDAITSLVLLTPLFPWIPEYEGESKNHYTFSGSLMDIAFLSAARLILAFGGLVVAYVRAEVLPEYPFDLYHANGDKKSREELEQEALEEPLKPWMLRYLTRPAFWAELLAVITEILVLVKCLARMNVEIGTLADAEPIHALFWIAILLSAVLSFFEASFLESICKLAGEYGKENLVAGGIGGDQQQPPGILQTIGSSLSIPLLAADHLQDQNHEEEQQPNTSTCTDEEGQVPETQNDDDENVRGTTDITADANYKASWRDLFRICYPDLYLICIAFVFLVLAAVAQVYIPRFLGNILDSLAATFADVDDDATHHKSMFEVPGFIDNTKYLVIASVFAGVFAGLRGSIFTVVGGRVNVRLRLQLMDSLLSQDIGFYDVTKIGDITSRLSSDTTLVGDQVSLNVNVFLRSLVQAVGVLLFMFLVSWQLSVLAFISVPLITIFSRWYGGYVQSLTKLMQKKLADGNSVSQASLGAMSTVRAFDAAERELVEFEKSMEKYLHLNLRAAVAYCGYACFTTTMPQLVFAVVVYYGGLLVRNGDMTSGQLVSFLLYLTSLSDAFASIGWVFSSLTQAIGASDKVCELMNRKARMKAPSREDPVPSDQVMQHKGIDCVQANKTRNLRTRGLWPSTCRGEIELRNVELFYPARPSRRVLDGLSLQIKPGSVVALVGESGGGKSSIVSLIQHMYEQTSGQVLIDGIEVHELAPAWLSQNVSVVSQQPTLFGRSIRRNIMYGLEGTDAEPSQEEIEAAARLAHADFFIQKMPQKYETEVGENGVQLSGGQRQRIAIARALVRKPRVLLLDEATSALDAESEHHVQEAIDEMLSQGKSNGARNMTVVVIAHRLSTVRSADCIYVLKSGQVVEQGTHEELIENDDGVYSALIRRQLDSQRMLDGSEEIDQSLVVDSSREDAGESFN